MEGGSALASGWAVESYGMTVDRLEDGQGWTVDCQGIDSG